MGGRFYQHPDTNVVFNETLIPDFYKVKDAAEKLHSLIPQVGIVNWDFTIDNEGIPVLIEGNMRLGGIWLFQMSHGSAAFGDKTAEVLEWIRKMKSTPINDRSKFFYGY